MVSEKLDHPPKNFRTRWNGSCGGRGVDQKQNLGQTSPVAGRGKTPNQTTPTSNADIRVWMGAALVLWWILTRELYALSELGKTIGRRPQVTGPSQS